MRLIKGILFFVVLLCTSPALAQTTFTVTNTDDNGEGSLRQAITDANENEGPDVIAFAIPGDGPHTITPQTFLPPMTDPVTLDGLSQPGADCSAWPPQLMIEIDGSEAGDFANGLGLGGGSDGSLVRGLVVNRFSNNGVGVYILANSNENHVACNFIGTDVSGTQSLGNSRGVFIRDARGNRIGGIEEAQRNLIAGNDNNVFIWNSGFADGATGNHIEGNYIGTDVQGTGVIGSDGSNVILAAASENMIGGAAEGAGNVIAGSGQHGVYIYSTDIGPATGNLIQGNRIGTDAGGTEDLGNAGDGVRILNASGNIIGGTTPAARNVISGNGAFGVEIFSDGAASADENLVQGNYIGLDATGSVALANDLSGVILRNSSGSLVGGAEEGARNVISGNVFSGIEVLRDEDFPAAADNRIENNFVGTDASGTEDLGNGVAGVLLHALSERTTVESNIISANDDSGIFIHATSPDNTISNNLIGVDAAGQNPLGNGIAGINLASAGNVITGNVIGGNADRGLFLGGPGTHVTGNYVGTDMSGQRELGNTLEGIAMTSPDNVIGGEGGGNVIAFNGAAGVSVLGAAAVNNSLLGNRIYANDGLGIDLGEDEVTENDDGDSDDGPNALQNYPVITEALIAGSVAIDGTLSSTASTSFRLDFFASGACDASGYGEGERFLDFEEVSTDADGEAVFSVTLEGEVEKGTFITATATDPEGNTSEFSACYEIVTGVTVEDEAEVPDEFALTPNYPNPFNPQTTIAFALPQAAEVRLVVYDVLGREVARLIERTLAAGRHEVVFEAARLPSGVYLYRLEADGFVQVRRMLLVK